MKKWDRENDSPCCDTVKTPMMPLKAEKKLEMDMWNMYYNLSTTVNYTLDRHWVICVVCLQKKSCGSSQGCDLISELSPFVLELQLYADKQVYNPFGSRRKGREKSPSKLLTQSVVNGRAARENAAILTTVCVFIQNLQFIIALVVIAFSSSCANWQSRVPMLRGQIVSVCKSPLTLISFSTGH